MKIRFVINPYRKGSKQNKFNPELSEYWEQIYRDLFKNWRG